MSLGDHSREVLFSPCDLRLYSETFSLLLFEETSADFPLAKMPTDFPFEETPVVFSLDEAPVDLPAGTVLLVMSEILTGPPTDCGSERRQSMIKICSLKIALALLVIWWIFWMDWLK